MRLVLTRDLKVIETCIFKDERRSALFRHRNYRSKILVQEASLGKKIVGRFGKLYLKKSSNNIIFPLLHFCKLLESNETNSHQTSIRPSLDQIKLPSA